MSSVVIALDNLRMGGFQRLALDQAYGFSKKGFSVQILVLSKIPSENVPSFIHLERQLIEDFKISIHELGDSRLSQLNYLRKISSLLTSAELLLSHSLRATMMLRIISKPGSKKLNVLTTIHQLPTLSKPKQRIQRFIYAQFSSHLLAYSQAVKQDWDFRFNSNFFIRKLIKCKEIKVVRNGIFLDRLPNVSSHLVENECPRLVYLGRNTSWKGISTFLGIASHPDLSKFEILFMIPDPNDLRLENIPDSIRDKVSIVAGKSIMSYRARAGDVHLYPANYGPTANYVESVSLNCLELASLGIPTVLSQRGLITWPDLVETGIFVETDWQDIDEVTEKINKISKAFFTLEQLQFIRSTISIENQLNALLKFSN